MIAVEANAHLAHTAALGKLEAQLNDNLDKPQGLRKSDVDQVLGNKTPESQKLSLLDTKMGAARVDIYSYSGLLRSRKLYVYYGVAGTTAEQEAEVMNVLTAVAPPPGAETANASVIEPDAQPAGPAGAGPGRGLRRRGPQDAGSQLPKSETDAIPPTADKPQADDTQTATEPQPAESKTEAATSAEPKADAAPTPGTEPKKE